MRKKDTTFKIGQVVQDAYGIGLMLEVLEEDDPEMTIGPCVFVRPVGENTHGIYMDVFKLKAC